MVTVSIISFTKNSKFSFFHIDGQNIRRSKRHRRNGNSSNDDNSSYRGSRSRSPGRRGGGGRNFNKNRTRSPSRGSNSNSFEDNPNNIPLGNWRSPNFGGRKGPPNRGSSSGRGGGGRKGQQRFQGPQTWGPPPPNFEQMGLDEAARKRLARARRFANPPPNSMRFLRNFENFLEPMSEIFDLAL